MEHEAGCLRRRHSGVSLDEFGESSFQPKPGAKPATQSAVLGPPEKVPRRSLASMLQACIIIQMRCTSTSATRKYECCDNHGMHNRELNDASLAWQCLLALLTSDFRPMKERLPEFCSSSIKAMTLSGQTAGAKKTNACILCCTWLIHFSAKLCFVLYIGCFGYQLSPPPRHAAAQAALSSMQSRFFKAPASSPRLSGFKVVGQVSIVAVQCLFACQHPLKSVCRPNVWAEQHNYGTHSPVCFFCLRC